MELKLNIYNKKTIVNTYTTDSYDLMYGTVEDLINVIDFEGLKSEDDVEFVKVVTKLVMNSRDFINFLLKDIFEGLTDDELKHTKVSDIVTVLINVVQSSVFEMLKGGQGKN